MTKERPDLGFGAELDSFDPKAWVPPKSHVANKPSKDLVAEAASASGFKSREGVASAAPKQSRRRRTGRNAQLNIKARPETIEAFYRLADANGWGLGETLEHAVALLEQESHPQK